jgi:hypothetical protein
LVARQLSRSSIHSSENSVVGREVDEVDAVFDSGDGLGFAALRGHAPDLILSVVGRLLVAGALDVRDEVDPGAVAVPHRLAVRGLVEGQTLAGVGCQVEYPEVAVSFGVFVLPAFLGVGHVGAVGGDGQLAWVGEGEVVVEGDVVVAGWGCGDGGERQKAEREDEVRGGGCLGGHGWVLRA